jgi:hypothetical protein
MIGRKRKYELAPPPELISMTVSSTAPSGRAIPRIFSPDGFEGTFAGPGIWTVASGRLG